MSSKRNPVGSRRSLIILVEDELGGHPWLEADVGLKSAGFWRVELRSRAYECSEVIAVHPRDDTMVVDMRLYIACDRLDEQVLRGEAPMRKGYPCNTRQAHEKEIGDEHDGKRITKIDRTTGEVTLE